MIYFLCKYSNNHFKGLVPIKYQQVQFTHMKNKYFKVNFWKISRAIFENITGKMLWLFFFLDVYGNGDAISPMFIEIENITFPRFSVVVNICVFFLYNLGSNIFIKLYAITNVLCFEHSQSWIITAISTPILVSL